MLTSPEWIPLEGVDEVPLIRALVSQGRRFVKPLRYDARTAAEFANAILLDAGSAPVALHVVSAFMRPVEHEAKRRAMARARGPSWAWSTEGSMPDLPVAARRFTYRTEQTSDQPQSKAP